MSTARQVFDTKIAEARGVAAVGQKLPEMSKLKGVARMAAVPLAKAVLRMAQVVTREQREFNQRVLEILSHLQAQVDNTVVNSRQNDSSRRDESHLLATLKIANDTLSERVHHYAATVENLSTEYARFTDAVRREMSNTQGQMQAQYSGLERGIQSLRTTTAIIDARFAASGTAPSASAAASTQPIGPADDDSFYTAFEDRFRGERKVILERLAPYVPLLRAAHEATNMGGVLDLGCGRGELIELCGRAGIEARGIDLNSDMVLRCKELGLNVEYGDLLRVLEKQPEQSLAGVTAIHLIEHLPLPVLRMLFKQSLRVLRPGGIIIFETPNPRNLKVGACDFYTDPTHHNPLNPVTMAFMAEYSGFSRVEVLPLHPESPPTLAPKTDFEKTVAALLDGPRDYAVVGYRP